MNTQKIAKTIKRGNIEFEECYNPIPKYDKYINITDSQGKKVVDFIYETEEETENGYILRGCELVLCYNKVGKGPYANVTTIIIEKKPNAIGNEYVITFQE